MNPRIPKLEALLARIHSNAAQPRIVAAAPPPAEESQGNEPGTMPSPRGELTALPEREVEVPLESRARLVVAPQSDEPEEIEADDVLELDDRHIVPETMTMTPPSEDVTRDALDVGHAQAAVAAAADAIVQTPEPREPEEPPPPSSRRPIAEPAETPQEAQIHVQHAPLHTPPPESGKQVAAEALSFDDDFTGVREAKPPTPQPEASIQLESLRSPPVKVPAPLDEMEAELPGSEATRPPPGPGPLPEMRSPRIESAEPTQVTAEVSRPTRPVAAAQVAEMVGTVKPASPQTFGALLDAALSL